MYSPLNSKKEKYFNAMTQGEKKVREENRFYGKRFTFCDFLDFSWRLRLEAPNSGALNVYAFCLDCRPVVFSVLIWHKCTSISIQATGKENVTSIILKLMNRPVFI
ncbi:MAG: hypothetical protein JRC99_12990 [Deltaproteobacteria bacterium]|nr:hypothetical protein [Deltaproteobacteria bacterium]